MLQSSGMHGEIEVAIQNGALPKGSVRKTALLKAFGSQNGLQIYNFINKVLRRQECPCTRIPLPSGRGFFQVLSLFVRNPVFFPSSLQKIS